MDGHRTAERRSLAYHQVIAERLPHEPALLERARTRVTEWRAHASLHERYVAAWESLLDRSLDDLVRRLVEDTEEMRALRQVTPFAGALDPRTRWQIWRSVA